MLRRASSGATEERDSPWLLPIEARRSAAANALDAEALVRGVRRCAARCHLMRPVRCLLQRYLPLNENDAASRGLAKALRSDEPKRHNSAKAAARGFATAGGAAAAVALVRSYFHDPPPERIQAVTDSVAALADLAASVVQQKRGD